ncbi:hypothetical protein Tco_0355868 [Tanacetum coccineum]
MGAGSTSNSQFSGFSSQAPMTPEQQAFFESQQAAFAAFQQDFQNRQQNPPQFEMPQQQSQSSNSLSQTESQPKRGRMKRTAKKGRSSEPIGDVTLRWTSDEETLLAECFVAVSEDPNVGRICCQANGVRLKREAAEKAFEVSKEKDRTITRLEELRFLALSTKDLSPDDAYWIELQKKQIKNKLRAQMPRDSNQTDDSDE